MAVQGTYGRGQMLGATVDPRLFVQDYSGFAKAGAIQGQALSDLGGQIGGAIEKTADMFKERKKIESSVKASRTGIESAIKLGESFGIDVKSSLQPILQKMDDPNTPLTESALLGDMAAKQITNVLNLGIGEQDRLMKMQDAQADAAYKAAQLRLEERRTAATEYTAKQAGTPSYQLKKVEIVDPQTGEVFEPELPFNPRTGRYFDQSAGKEILDIQEWSKGKPSYVEDTAMPTPTSQVGGSVSDLIANAAQMNIGKLSTAKTPGTQGGNVGCADAICRTFKQATGEELIPGGTLSTREMATTLENDPRFVKVPLGSAEKGDIVLTPRRGNKAGHTGIVLDGGAIASNSSRGFAGKAPGTFVQNYTIDSWRKKVAPRNPKETAAYRYIGSQGINNSLSMSGDMSQQAMGTPEQQAIIANMIEGNQGLATAQNVPQGAIATEPSAMPTQPQQVAPQAPAMSETARAMMQRGFRPKAQSKFRTFTAEEEQQYGSKGQVNTETGEIRLIRPPSGMEIVTENGRTTYRQGPGVTGKVERAEQAAQKQSVQQLKAIASATESVVPLIKRASTNPLLSKAGTLIGDVLPASEAGRLAASLETINVQNSLATINEQRKSSVTGGIGGNITEKEWPRFENRVGKIQQGMAPDDLLKNVQLSALNQFEAVNGEPKDVIKLLQDGKIDQTQFNEYVEAYDSIRASAEIPLIGIGGKADSWTAYDTNLRKFYKGAGPTQGITIPSGTMDKIQEMRSRLNKY